MVLFKIVPQQNVSSLTSGALCRSPTPAAQKEAVHVESTPGLGNVCISIPFCTDTITSKARQERGSKLIESQPKGFSAGKREGSDYGRKRGGRPTLTVRETRHFLVNAVDSVRTVHIWQNKAHWVCKFRRAHWLPGP